MDANGMIFGKELAAGCLVLVFFGVLYNLGLQKVSWLKQLRTADQVVIGVLFTLLVSMFVVGIEIMLQMFLLFFASGFPMWIGALIRAANDETEAKKIQKEQLK
jgi:4-hydroxybenzoate polyprenyltransferase